MNLPGFWNDSAAVRLTQKLFLTGALTVAPLAAQARNHACNNYDPMGPLMTESLVGEQLDALKSTRMGLRNDADYTKDAAEKKQATARLTVFEMQVVKGLSDMNKEVCAGTTDAAAATHITQLRLAACATVGVKFDDVVAQSQAIATQLGQSSRAMADKGALCPGSGQFYLLSNYNANLGRLSGKLAP